MNITYYGGQIKPEFRGHFAVFLTMQRDRDDPILFSKIPMGTKEYIDSSALNLTRPFPVPIRAYLQVNDEAYNKLKKSFKIALEKDTNFFSESTLDKIVVEEIIVDAYSDAIKNFLYREDINNLRRALN